jgi:uncharacterized protein YcbK (DUF882 family)
MSALSFIERRKRLAGRVLGVVVAMITAAATPAAADVTHVIGRGHTIEAIAHRYHVTVKSIVDANHLKDPRHLKIGDTLTIPGVSPPGTKAKSGAGIKGVATKGGAAANPTYAMRAKTPGVIHATRLATNEEFVVRVSSRRGHVSPTALSSFEKMMRSGGGLTHPPDPRLVELLGTVSNHFGSRRLEIISGFRPYSPSQYTAHSNHNIGHAMDFRVVGVPNEVLRDYCRTLHNVGVGYYPNSTFVHLDVRTSPTFWIDYSRPGEPPRYNAADVDADEGTSDVSEEQSHSPDQPRSTEPTSPSEAPLPQIPPTSWQTPKAAVSAPSAVTPAPGSPAPSSSTPASGSSKTP